MGEETPEAKTEEEEEIEEYVLVQKEESKEKTEIPTKKPEKKPEKTTITRDKKIKGWDYCPFCESEKLGKDHKKNIYVCLDCGGTYRVEQS